MMKKLFISLLALTCALSISGAPAFGDDGVYSNADLATTLATQLGVEGDFASSSSSLSDEDRFQQGLSLLPGSLQELLAALFPGGPVNRSSVSGILGLYLDTPQIDEIMGDGLPGDLLNESDVLTFLETSGFADQFQDDETLGFIAPDTHDFDSTDRQSEELKENFRIPLSGGEGTT